MNIKVLTTGKRILLNGSLLFASILISLLLVELLLRLIFTPADYLGTEMLPDDRLGHRIKPYSSGHDAWGFRNESVPDQTDIVTIGDSQTYGAATPRKYNWPSVLSKRLNRNVYNLGLGGYGCVEYYSMLVQEAIKLRPKLAIVAVYLGNDILDAYDSVYYRDYWKSLRDSTFVFKHDADNTSRVNFLAPRNFVDHLTRFLVSRSMLYKLSVYAFTENIWQRFLIRQIPAKSRNEAYLKDENLGILTGFTPRLREQGLNLDDIRVQEGLRLTINRLNAIHDFCRDRNIKLLVVLIPTKEKVFESVISTHPEINFFPTFQKLFVFEDKVKQIIITNLKSKEIQYVDVFPQLRNAVTTQQIYPITRDGHPNKNGCRIIASRVAEICEKHFMKFLLN
jgi:hypothetical protein